MEPHQKDVHGHSHVNRDKEYSWVSNFNRFEPILPRKVLVEGKKQSGEHRQDREQGRCRGPEECPWNSPHMV